MNPIQEWLNNQQEMLDRGIVATPSRQWHGTYVGAWRLVAGSMPPQKP